MGALFMIGLGWAVSVYGRPFTFAAGFALLSLVTGVLIGDGIPSSLIGTVVAFAYCSAYFWLIDRYSSNILLYVVILVGGAIIWFVGPLLILGRASVTS